MVRLHMSHQRHWGCLTAMPRCMVPAVVHVSCEDQTDKIVQQRKGERKDRQRYNRFCISIILPLYALLTSMLFGKNRNPKRTIYIYTYIYMISAR